MIENVIAGLNIFNTKSNSKEIFAGHDVIYAGDCLAESLSVEELKILKDNHWHWSEDEECWYYFT